MTYNRPVEKMRIYGAATLFTSMVNIQMFTLRSKSCILHNELRKKNGKKATLLDRFGVEACAVRPGNLECDRHRAGFLWHEILTEREDLITGWKVFCFQLQNKRPAVLKLQFPYEHAGRDGYAAKASLGELVVCETHDIWIWNKHKDETKNKQSKSGKK